MSINLFNVKNIFLFVLCLVIAALIVAISGWPNIPVKAKRTNIFSFQDLPLEMTYNISNKGLPFKYNYTKYRDDPSDSCTKCNLRYYEGTQSTPCTCGMPNQIYYSKINWFVAIIDWFIVSIILTLIAFIPCVKLNQKKRLMNRK